MGNKRTALIVSLVVFLLLMTAIIFVLTRKDATSNSTESTTSTNSSVGQANKSATEKTTTPTDTPTTTTDTVSQLTIIYTEAGFDKPSYTVAAGKPVTVTNSSQADLQFSSDKHPTHELNDELNLNTLAPGKSVTFTPTRVGTWGFHDHIHADETGTLVVTE